MPSDQGKVPHPPEEYDVQVRSKIPYYDLIHAETVELVRAYMSSPSTWLDTGCGTGSLVQRALAVFPSTRFILADPSADMLEQTGLKLNGFDHVTILRPCRTQDISMENFPIPDVITAIQCHHYLSREERKRAIEKCQGMLREDGLFITTENVRPLTDKGIEVGKKYWGNHQIMLGRSMKEVEDHLARFDREYFPITVEEHLEQLRAIGFTTVELFWYSYMQAGFYCIK